MGKKRLTPTPLDKEVSLILKEKASGTPLRKLEELSGVSLNNLSRTFKFERTILISELELLCDALGLTDWKVLREAHQRLDAPHPPSPTTQNDYALAAHDNPDFDDMREAEEN